MKIFKSTKHNFYHVSWCLEPFATIKKLMYINVYPLPEKAKIYINILAPPPKRAKICYFSAKFFFKFTNVDRVFFAIKYSNFRLKCLNMGIFWSCSWIFSKMTFSCSGVVPDYIRSISFSWFLSYGKLSFLARVIAGGRSACIVY